MGCTGTDAMLSNMCGTSHLPSGLRSLRIQCSDNGEGDVLSAFNSLLGKLNPVLEEIYLDLWDGNNMPHAGEIARHGSTLAILNIHVIGDSALPAGRAEREIFWDGEELDALCDSLEVLQQFSCALPPFHILKRPKQEWLDSLV